MKNGKKIGYIVFFAMLALYISLFVFFRFFDLLEAEDRKLFQASVDLFTLALGLVLYYACLLDRDEISGLKLCFLRIVVVVFVGMVTEIPALITNGIPEMAKVNHALYTIVFICNPLSAFFFFYYLVEYLGVGDNIIVRIMRPGLWILFGTHCIVQFINCYGPLFFYYNKVGEYTRAVFYPLANLFSYICGACVILVLNIYRKRLKLYQFLILFVFFVAPLVSLAINIVVRLSPVFSVLMCVLLVIYCVLNIERSRERSAVEAELSLATEIQANMLPCIFPAFPERPELDIYASMTPAKEVGGDFYDYFLLDDDHLVIVIADVSGKGVPASLFMVTSMIMIRDCAMYGGSPAETLEMVNRQICANNPTRTFVTVWFGKLEISTGKMICTNAGHEFPIINTQGSFELLNDKHGMPVGVKKKAKYTDYEMELKDGDSIFLYTDGVAEANNIDGDFFGAERLIEAVNLNPGAVPETVLNNVRKAVDDFVKEAPQFDDLTMLGFKYKRNK